MVEMTHPKELAARRIAAVVLACAALSGGVAAAAEGGAVNYPAGAAGPFVGEFPPIPGIFALSQFSYSSADALYDSKGKKLPVPFSLSAPVETMRFVSYYGIDVLGAKVYWQLVLPGGGVWTKVGGETFSSGGFSNVTITPFALNWVQGCHQYTLGFDIALPPPLSSYSYRHNVNLGSGYASFVPLVVYRYDDPNGLDIGGSLRFMTNTRNPDTKYLTGNTLIADFYAGWNIGKLKLGVAGNWTQQIEDDRIAGATLPNNRLASLGLGPSIGYDFGAIRVNVNYQQNVYARSGANTSAAWLNVSFPVFVPPPPQAAVTKL